MVGVFSVSWWGGFLWKKNGGENTGLFFCCFLRGDLSTWVVGLLSGWVVKGMIDLVKLKILKDSGVA